MIAATLFTSCSSKQNVKEQDPHQSQHCHSCAFSDKHAVEAMAANFESAGRDSVQQPQKVVEYLGDLKGKTLMDIGAATGYFSVKFADKGAHVIAADVSDAFQDYLKQRIEQNRITNIELRKTPYDSPLLKDQEADLVFMANTYHHIENRVDYFSKVKKGLKADGELIVVDYFRVELPEGISAPPMDMRVSVDEVVLELKQAGFKAFEAELGMLPYQYLIRAK